MDIDPFPETGKFNTAQQGYTSPHRFSAGLSITGGGIVVG
jgi:hypothetical protein